jgi:5-carboxyvanillate decarboxylase
MKKIAIEEHFFTKEYLNYLRTRLEYPRLETFTDEKGNNTERMWRSTVNYTIQSPAQISKLLDTGSGRISTMDSIGIDLQVLSIASPGVDELDVPTGTDIARKLNDELARIISFSPKKFAGLAAIAPGDPVGAANELERAVRQLRLKGAKLNSHGRGEYLDDKKYWVLFEKAEELSVPIYLHPKEPPQNALTQYMPYSDLASAMWGFGADTGLHAMRLICSGLFDTFPKLKIILGHLGEGIPFWLWRIDNIGLKTPISHNLRRKPSEYFKDNFLVTTSGMFWQPAFMLTYHGLSADNILFAVDYPYESNEQAVQFMEALPICDSDKEKIYHLNAEKLFDLPPI